MDPSPTPKKSSKFVQKDQCDIFYHSTKYPSSRRTPSFSSFSSLSSSSSSSLGSSSYNPDDSPLSPATPLRFSGVPFSWEHFPGIPKKKQLKVESSSMKLLPLPPQTTTNKMINVDETITGVRIKKSTINHKQPFTSDPFFTALVECSKDADHDHDHDQDQEPSNENFWNIATAKVSRSLSDRFGLINLYTSCKTTCNVTESIRHLPRSSRSSYDLINNSRPR